MQTTAIIYASARKEMPERELLEAFEDYLGCLEQNGQILNYDYFLRSKDGYSVYVTASDASALDQKKDSVYASRPLKNISVRYELIGDDPQATEDCLCNEHSHYILYCNPKLIKSPVTCGDCGKDIPLYQLPHPEGESDHGEIIRFQNAYNSVDHLWMYCLADRFTKRQLTYPLSALNKIGSDLACKYERSIGKPVYLSINKLYSNDSFTECSECHAPLRHSLTASTSVRYCDVCRLIFGIFDSEVDLTQNTDSKV